MDDKRVAEIGGKLFQVDGSRGYPLSCLVHGSEALDDLEYVFKVLTTAQARIAELEAWQAGCEKAFTEARHADRVAGVRKGVEKARGCWCMGCLNKWPLKPNPFNLAPIHEAPSGMDNPSWPCTANGTFAIDADAAAREISNGR